MVTLRLIVLIGLLIVLVFRRRRILRVTSLLIVRRATAMVVGLMGVRALLLPKSVRRFLILMLRLSVRVRLLLWARASVRYGFLSDRRLLWFLRI